VTIISFPANEYVPRLRLPSQVILDAGGDTSGLLAGSLYRCIDDMLCGQVLQVFSGDVRSREDVSLWCEVTEHELIALHEDGKETVFWIRKR
jgi:TusA-related sulfurtransferase